MAVLELQDFRLSLGSVCLIEQLSFQVAAGEILCIMGKSGKGKSSLLHYLLGVLHPNFQAEGTILLDGNPLNSQRPEQRKIGMVFQDPLLFPHMTVLENLLFALPDGRKQLAKAKQALAVCELTDKAAMKETELSGGEKARVALFRTLLAEPKALLLDEPFSKFDAELKNKMQIFFLEHIKEHHLPTVFVSHDQREAEALKAKLFLL